MILNGVGNLGNVCLAQFVETMGAVSRVSGRAENPETTGKLGGVTHFGKRVALLADDSCRLECRVA